jgi:hypothetical protein
LLQVIAGLSHSPDIQTRIRKKPGLSERAGRLVDQKSMDYFRRRELAERAAAKNAQSEAARRVHQELAQEYADLIRGPQFSAHSEVRR